VVRKRGGEFDAVYLHRCVNAFKYAGVIRAATPRARIIYSVADLHHLRQEREAALSGSEAALRQAADLRAREMSAVTMADAVITHSSHEAAYLAEAAPEARIATIPWAVPLRRPGRGFAERSGLAYVGGYRHPPNVDAVVHFVREVMPHLRRMIPGLVFHIVGSHMPPGFHELAAADVVLDGFVADLGACLEERRLTVAPLRYGAGVKGKVLESLSRGVPCVASPVAAEGMDLRHSEDIAIADHPLAFAEQVAWLYQDEANWTKLQAGGLAYVERSCSEAAIIGHFRELFARLDGS
jgi:glycosyltransferase involved in cell wall biosynthesis